MQLERSKWSVVILILAASKSLPVSASVLVLVYYVFT